MQGLLVLLGLLLICRVVFHRRRGPLAYSLYAFGRPAGVRLQNLFTDLLIVGMLAVLLLRARYALDGPEQTIAVCAVVLAARAVAAAARRVLK